MSFITQPVTGVKNFYGPRTAREGIAGSMNVAGSVSELSIVVTGTNINDGIMDSVAVLPAGSKVLKAYVETAEVAALTGTTPTILIGTNGSEVTNGLVVSEAQAEAVGTYDVSGTLTGTWALRLAADTSVSVTLGGTTPAITDAGKYVVVIQYINAA